MDQRDSAPTRMTPQPCRHPLVTNAQRPANAAETRSELQRATFAEQELLALLGGLRRDEQVALPLRAAMVGEERELLGPLDPFGDDVDAERLTERDDGGGDGAVVGVVRHAVHEAAIDLQRVDREEAQCAERRVAGAEIVDRDAHALGLERAQVVDRAAAGAHRDALGDLDLEVLGGKPRLVEHLLDARHEIGVLELAHGEVHRGAQMRLPAVAPALDLAARLAKHPLAHRHDRARRLREPDELGRRAGSRARGDSSGAAPPAR